VARFTTIRNVVTPGPEGDLVDVSEVLVNLDLIEHAFNDPEGRTATITMSTGRVLIVPHSEARRLFVELEGRPR
jgi:hypothetical protein